ncbi:MAG: HEAT repeat domain-containing protein [Nitrospirota bacterium]
MDDPIPKPSPVDPRELTRLLTDFQVGIRKVSMYSASHRVVPGIVASLTAQFHALTRSHGTLHIASTKDEILYAGTPIASSNPVIRELARLLNGLNIAGIDVCPEVTDAHISSFLRLLAGSRGTASSVDSDRALDEFGRATPTIVLQFISFQGAVKDRTDSDGGEGITASHLWRGLVSRLTAEGTPAAVQTALDAAAADPANAQRVAAAISLIVQHQQASERSYERTIVKYLREQAAALPEEGPARAELGQEISRMFGGLTSDVRQHLLRTSIEASEEDAAPADALIETLPMPMMMEVLDQIRGAGKDVSLPGLTLLKKLVTLSGTDPTLAATLQEKLPEHHDLLQDLLTKRAERTYYPTQYRALLDQEFADQAVPTSAVARPEAITLDEHAIDQHLALILLETLEAPIRSEEQYRQTVIALKELLIHSLAERAAGVFNDAIAILAARYGSAADAQRPFLQDCIRELLQREFLPHLLAAADPADEQRQRDALAQMIHIVGPSVIPLLLDKLEDEQNLKMRKRLLTILRDCGDAVVPLAIGRLAHAQWYVVRNMLSLLRDLRAVPAVPAIAKCLAHTSSQVRLAAFQTLGALAPQAAEFIGALKRALDDDDPKVFRAALTHLVSSHDTASLQLAARLLLDDAGARRERQVAAINAIGQAGNTALVPLLLAVQRRHLLRFWTWRTTSAVRTAVNRALITIRARGGAPDVGHQDAA